MADSWFACKGCSGSDRTQDTVKVDPKLLAQGHGDKENLVPSQFNGTQDDAISKKHEAEERARVEAARKAEQRKAEKAAAAAAEEERLRQEMQRASAEEAQRREEERLRQEMEEIARQEEAAVAAKAAQEAEEDRRRMAALQAAEAKRAQELAAKELGEAQEKVSEWCKLHGYGDVNAHKKTMRGATKFPLHTAVKHKDEEMVGLLLKCGADQSKASSKNQSPFQLAQKMNSNGSHDAIIAMLR